MTEPTRDEVLDAAMAFRVADPAKALEWALAHGAELTERFNGWLAG